MNKRLKILGLQSSIAKSWPVYCNAETPNSQGIPKRVSLQPQPQQIILIHVTGTLDDANTAKRLRRERESRGSEGDAHMIEEVGAAGAALELLGDDGVLGRGVDAASPALEHPVPVQSLHEQQPHPPTNTTIPKKRTKTSRSMMDQNPRNAREDQIKSVDETREGREGETRRPRKRRVASRRLSPFPWS